ncbi:MAG: MerR family transcriptional regulator [Muribaculaceae bacterium]|nr:MerR family transcriptional regulator [Muribaculaceae bacterium]
MDLTKTYYKIAEVSEMLNVPQSTLRYWERVFKELSPTRTLSGRRHYTSKDIEHLEIIKFLVKDRGMRIDAVKEQMHNNLENISRRVSLIKTLQEAKSELNAILEALKKRR